jgi:peptidoglycan/xylan/chitin deacetylase (PgdA/CDA1 family)/SAM-dependent methyltransferase
LARISILVPVYDGAAFLDPLVHRVRDQTFSDWELILFDDGSRDGSRDIARRWAQSDPRIRALSHPGHANHHQLATRVAAAEAARCDVVALLDQDDEWDVDYLEKHLARWAAVAPRNVQLSYGPGLYWYPDAPQRDYVQPMPSGAPGVFDPPELLSSFFEGVYAPTPLPSATLMRRDVLRAAARFSEAARGSQCEDQYLWWFVAARWRVAIHGEPWVRYRQHEESALARMLAAPALARPAERRFLESTRAELRLLHPTHPLLSGGRLERRLGELVDRDESRSGRLREGLARLARSAPTFASVADRLREGGRRLGARSRLAYGVAPLSEAFGEDRGKPLTRYYVEQFLAEHAGDVRGRCLEFEGADYTERYGEGEVESSDVLHLDASSPSATIIADLSKPNALPSDRFDCIVCTFVLHEIYGLKEAVRELHRILAPGGTMLVAVPHVTMCEPRYNELWRFTVQGLTELLGETFGAEATSIRAYGNSLTAAAQLRGLVAEEFSEEELNVHDPRFAVVVCARVTKAEPAEPDDHAPFAEPAPPAELAPAEIAAPTVTARAEAAARAVAEAPARGAARPRRSGSGTGVGRALVLLYHRSAAPPQDAHALCVPPSLFQEHLDVISQLGRPISLLDLARAVEVGSVPPRAIAITFDDGYADNLLEARPALERYGVPATVFVTSGYVGAQREFWWDAIERLLLETPRLPRELRVRLSGIGLGGGDMVWSLGDAATWTDVDLERYRGWNVLDPESPTARHEVFRRALDDLRPLPDLVRRGVLAQLFAQAGASDAPRPTHRALDPGELRRLADGSLVDVGAHSVTHPQLSALSVNDQRVEIAQSRARLEELLDRPVQSFAYPFGGPRDYDASTVSLVREQGFRVACSNFPGLVTSETPLFELPRVMVMSWTAEELGRRLDELLGPT